MTVLVRFVNPKNSHEAHAHSEEGTYWIEIYNDTVQIARILVIDWKEQK